MVKTSICTQCNKNCVMDIYIYKQNIEILGNQCDKGLSYIEKLDYENKKVFTTIVRIKGAKNHTVLPVKSSDVIDKNLWIECSKALSRLYVGPPVKLGDIICKNILNTGVDILSCRTIERD